MIYSHSIKLSTVRVPNIEGEISMKRFRLDTLFGLPYRYVGLVRSMLDQLPVKYGWAYLTVHGKKLEAGETLRRPGPHIDGNYLPDVCGWGSGGGNDWKVTEDTPKLSPEHFNRSYRAKTGGMVIVSNMLGCIGWNGMYMDEPKTGGDCSHIQELTKESSFELMPNVVYYGNSQFIHESIPMEHAGHRTMVRITLPEKYPWLKPNTNE